MSKNNIILSEATPVEFQEAYNILRTNLNCVLDGEKSKIIALTGGEKDDVSSVALNMSISFSQIDNNRVLLIDGDMHYSGLSAMLEVSDKDGLSNCLSGSSTREKCTVSLNNIDFLPAGSKTANPANLLDSQAAVNFCNDVKKCYDYVFIVLPSVCHWSDGVIFAKYADGFVPVVRHNITRYKELKSLINNLSLADGRILGFVYNKAPGNRRN